MFWFFGRLYVWLIIFCVSEKFLLLLVGWCGRWNSVDGVRLSVLCVFVVRLWLMISGMWLLVCILLNSMLDLIWNLVMILLFFSVLFLYGCSLIMLFIFICDMLSLIGSVLVFFIVL